MAVTVVIMFSCAGSKHAAQSTDPVRSKVTTIEGEKVVREDVRMQGIEMSESLNDDGTEIVSRPFKWYAGLGKADNRQVAIELAQREAYATISRVVSNAVKDQASRGNVANNGQVQQALRSHWEQVSISIQQGCEPYGNVSVEYSPTTHMYSVTAKVAIRGDQFNRMMNAAGSYKPANLTGDDLARFIEANEAIMQAAKGN